MNPTNLLTLALGLCSIPASGVLQADPVTFYVATNGNDAWSGRSPRLDPQGKDGPKASLPAALEAARATRRASSDRIEILLRNGTHLLDAPLEISAQDSGASADAPLVLAAYQREQPVVSGGKRLTGWTEVPGQPGLWEITLPEVKEGKAYYRSLFINGERRQRARSPNVGYYRIQGPSPQDKPVRIPFREGDIRKAWAEDGDVEVVAFLAWADLRMPIRAVDEQNRVATLAGDPRPSNKENNAKYFVENVPDGLDAPGEWYLNRRTGVLRYMALPKENPNRSEVIVPRIDSLLALRGNVDKQTPVRHVALRGLTLAYTDWPLGPQGYADTQAAVAVEGDIRLEYAQDSTIENCLFRHLAGYGLELGRGCQRIRVAGNEMVDLGGGGIRIGEPALREPAFDQNGSHEIINNHLHRLGRIYYPAVGVVIFQSGGNRLAHNHIHDLFYSAISVGWTWGYRETPCRDNLIEFNHLHHIGQDVLSDMGAVYTLGIQRGTVIRNNLIHDVSAFTYGGWGLYTDEGSSHILLESNVVYRCKSAGFHQHYGRENIVRNNIFAFNREHQLMRTREEEHESFTFERNIVYFDSGDLLGSNWSNNHFRMDNNVYYDARLGGTPETLPFKGATWSEWRARGHDTHSVCADPLFTAPQKFNFRLRKGSPALSLGFQPIRLDEVGPRR